MDSYSSSHTNAYLPIIFLLDSFTEWIGGFSNFLIYKMSNKCYITNKYFSVFSPNAGNMDQKKLRIWILFTQ